MSRTLWSDVRVSMESAAETAVTISAVTQANPPVVTAAGHGLVDGDRVRMTVSGMNQLNNRLFRVKNVAGDDFELERNDGTNFDEFSAGTLQKITMGHTMNTVIGVSASGGEPKVIDMTTIHDSVDVEQFGSSSAISYSFENHWDLTDPALDEMNKVSQSKEQKGFLFVFKNKASMSFVGSVNATLVPVGSAQDKVTTPTTLSLAGLPNYYID